MALGGTASVIALVQRLVGSLDRWLPTSLSGHHEKSARPGNPERALSMSGHRSGPDVGF